MKVINLSLIIPVTYNIHCIMTEPPNIIIIRRKIACIKASTYANIN
ncbi:MAG: hypothetical protein Faunusvirus6_19 [Faunusvirus sp.]|uniref:Uncharacterized protein n=1 Tax=Faunusvirus sp. TaxID=2487766 RepID=A0A3G4ZZ04_9VIRU|nr:MAG: hypothetical protein Faunusvirus6_19 [Faunusvirus sp.]